MLDGLSANVRGAAVPSLKESGRPQPAAMTARGELLVAQGVPLRAEQARLGNTWSTRIAAANAFMHVAALPTTRAELVLYNGEPAHGLSYLIESVFAMALTSIAAASAYTLLGQIVPSGTAPTDDTAHPIVNRSGRGGLYAGLARRAIANTAFALADRWDVLGSVPAGPAASIGLAVVAEIKGGLILPPGAILCLNVVAGTAAGTGTIGVEWSEVQL